MFDWARCLFFGYERCHPSCPSYPRPLSPGAKCANCGKVNWTDQEDDNDA